MTLFTQKELLSLPSSARVFLVGGKAPDRKGSVSKKLTEMSTSDLLALWETTEDAEVRHEAHRIIQARKGKDYPVGLGAMFRIGR